MRSGIKLSWWQLGLLSLALSAIGGLASGRSKKKERKLYNRELRQAPWAPPAWLFGPAWTVNNLFLLKALRELLIRDDLPRRQSLLVRQGLIWVIFFSFGYIYFRKKSPILAAAWTLADAFLAGSSFVVAGREDKTLARNYLPLLGWTSFATTLAVYQALTNKDAVLEVDPRPGLRQISRLLPRFSAS